MATFEPGNVVVLNPKGYDEKTRLTVNSFGQLMFVNTVTESDDGNELVECFWIAGKSILSYTFNAKFLTGYIPREDDDEEEE